MQSIINTLLFIVAIFIVLVLTGIISQDELLDMLGEVQEGKTEQIYEEGKFRKAFDLIIGDVEIYDTSRTEFKRDIVFCKAGYVIHTTKATIQYQVQTTPETFYLDAKKKEYYIAPELGVTYMETGKQTDMSVEESNCVKRRNISIDEVNSTKRKAEAALKKAIENSDKMKSAYNRFEEVKAGLIKQFEEAGFMEALPPNVIQNPPKLD